jgi:hypothetical protein
MALSAMTMKEYALTHPVGLRAYALAHRGWAARTRMWELLLDARDRGATRPRIQGPGWVDEFTIDADGKIDLVGGTFDQ